jgi:hypothetical protein
MQPPTTATKEMFHAAISVGNTGRSTTGASRPRPNRDRYHGFYNDGPYRGANGSDPRFNHGANDGSDDAEFLDVVIVTLDHRCASRDHNP